MSENKEELDFMERFNREVLGANYEKELGTLAEQRELMDVETLFKHAETKRKLELPNLGCYVYYTPLRIGDRIDINKITHQEEIVQRDMRNRRKLYLLLSRADKRYTEDIIASIPAQVIDNIIYEYSLQEETPFLPHPLRKRLIGLNTMQDSKESSP